MGENVFCKGCKEFLYIAEKPKEYRVPFCNYCLDAIFQEHWIITELKEMTKLNSDALANAKKELRDEFRQSVEQVEIQIKELENPPVPVEGEGKKFDSIIKIWKFFLGKIR